MMARNLNIDMRRTTPPDPKFAESLKIIKQNHLKETFQQRYGREDFINNDITLNRRCTSFNEMREEVRLFRQNQTQQEFRDLRDLVNRNNYFNTESDLETFRKSKRFEIIKQIEDIMSAILKDISDKKYPKFVLRNQRLWSNCVFENNNVACKDLENGQITVISYSVASSKKKFCAMMHMLMVIHQLLTKNLTCTKRELYYQNIDKFNNQMYTDLIIRDICCILNCPQWEMGVLSTSKGLVAGHLTVTFFNSDVVVNCLETGGVLVPQDIFSIKSVTSDAQFILVIEKDAIFQKLLDENIINRLTSCILITGKGYPDINTRLFLKFLVDCLRIPSLALVDADPYGIEIMCVYRYGSLGMSHINHKLAIPSLKWIGVFPSEIYQLNTPSIALTEQDIAKARELLTRPYMSSNNNLRLEVQKLIDLGRKTEIEGVATLSQAYLTDRYIPHKICARNII